jgi:hypothetical protein
MEGSDPAAWERSRERVRGLADERGSEARRLTVGPLGVTIAGLDPPLARRLDERWGAFASEAPGDAATVRIYRAGERWLPSHSGRPYAIEAAPDGGLVLAERFALARDGDGTWRAGVVELPEEPVERIVENVTRLLVARSAIEAGGFALHAAGVAREGRAYLFAGPSRAGKSTIARLTRPARSLGDDYGVALPGPEGWVASAVPFDNAERAPSGGAGTLPLAGIWRLYQAAELRVEHPPERIAVATLVACAVAPWTMADLSGRLLAQVASFLATGRYAHLHFPPDASPWSVLLEGHR